MEQDEVQFGKISTPAQFGTNQNRNVIDGGRLTVVGCSRRHDCSLSSLAIAA